MFGRVWQFLVGRYFDRDREVPKVNISMKLEAKGGEPASPAPDTSGLVHWTVQLVLTNESIEPAADLKLVWPTGEPSFQALLPYYLSLYEEKVVLVRGETRVAPQTFEEASPEELFELLIGRPNFLLTYRDARGDQFHSRYSRSEGRESVEFLKELPQTE